MAKKKSSKSKSKPRSQRRRSAGGKKGTHRRRRNPRSDFMSRAGRLAGLALATLGAGAIVMVAQSRIQPGTWISEYGIPVVGFAAGVAIARKAPTVGVGIAAGSAAAPFVVPLASKVSTMLPAPTTTTTATTQGLAAVSRALLGPSRVGAVQARMAGVHMGRAYHRYAA